MSQHDTEYLEDLFVALLDLDSVEQRVKLARLHAKDASGANWLERKLKNYQGFDEGILEALEPQYIEKRLLSVTQDGQPLYGCETPLEAPLPERIGAYRIIRLIGEGGMGRVFLAEQSRPKRKVALKLISAHGVANPRRFRLEYQAHAQMKHPNIATLMEVGSTTAGEIFFTMEYLEGLPLDVYCREKDPDLRQRIELVRQVCLGVQHAHQRAILHRDLKPSNIIVVDSEEGPRAKIIDWGLAKNLSTDETFLELTQTGQIIGTPIYMSPEQLQGRPIDTRSDIYALGVMLYLLLAGRHPLDLDRLKSLDMSEVWRVCLETSFPPPSARVLPGSSARLRRKSLTGDLDAVTMKAVARDQEDRYTSLAELIQDLDDYLQGRPVKATSPNIYNRAWKFIKRNKFLVSVGSLAICAMVFGLAVATVSYIRLNKANLETERALAELKISSAFLEETFSSPDPRVQGPNARVVDLLEGAQQRLDAIGSDFPSEGHLRTVWGTTWLGLGIYEKAEEQLAAALLANQRLLGTGHVETSSTRYFLAMTLMRQKRITEALTMIDQCIGFLQEDPGPLHPDCLRARAGKAFILTQAGEYDAGEALLREVYSLQREVSGEDHESTIRSLVALGNILFGKKDFLGAERHYREALKRQVSHGGRTTPESLASRHNLGNCLLRLRRFEDAQAVIEETIQLRSAVLGPTHPLTLQSRKLLAGCFYRQKMYNRAEMLLTRLIRDCEAGGEIMAELQIRSRLQLANAYLKNARADDAIHTLETLLSWAQTKKQENHPLVLNGMHNLGHILKETGALIESRNAYERALDRRIQWLGVTHLDTLKTWYDLAQLYGELGEDPDGFFIKRVWQYMRTVSPRNPYASTVSLGYAQWLKSAGHLAEAQTLLNELYDEACLNDARNLRAIEHLIQKFEPPK